MANERLLLTSGLANAAAALSITDASLPTLSLNLESKSISEDRGTSENRGDRTQAILTRHTPNTAELTVSLSSTPAVRIPETVTFAAGETTASFTVSAINDTLATGTQTATITAAANGFISDTAQIDVLDDDVPKLSLTLATDTIAENGRTTAGIIRNTSISTPLTVSLSSSDRTEATVPEQITFNRGERLAIFSISGVNDGILDSTQTTTISATAPGFTHGAATISVIDATTATDATIFVDATNTIRGSAFSAGKQYKGQLFSNTDSHAILSDDLIVGTEGNDHIWAGRRGSDRINSKGGHDIIGIGSGSAFVTAGEGDDFVYAIGNDAIGSSTGTSVIALGEGNNSVWMPNGNSTITAGAGNDVIGLGTGTAAVRAGSGNNIIYQAATSTTGDRDGNKDIVTGAGEDYIALGSGDDLIDGGTGLNTLLGGAGADTFVIRVGAYNFLGDFELGIDKIRLVDLSADALTFFQGSGDQADSVFGFTSGSSHSKALFEIVDATVAEVNSHHIFV